MGKNRLVSFPSNSLIKSIRCNRFCDSERKIEIGFKFVQIIETVVFRLNSSFCLNIYIFFSVSPFHPCDRVSAEVSVYRIRVNAIISIFHCSHQYIRICSHCRLCVVWRSVCLASALEFDCVCVCVSFFTVYLFIV